MAPSNTSSSSKPKSVRFAEDYAPSAIKIRVKCGPADDPALIITIRLLFEVGKKPRIRFSFDRPREDLQDGEPKRKGRRRSHSHRTRTDPNSV